MMTRPMETRRLPHWAAPLVAALVLVVFSRNVAHYASVGDDAFISFRYARHLVAGLGLVWNPGERVEGYTNFLWVLLMAAGLRLGIAPEGLSNALGVASGLVVLIALACFQAARTGWRDPLVFLAPLALALSRSFAAWSTGGLETQLFAALVLLGLLAFLRERVGARPVASSLLLAAATLTRPEGLLSAAVAGGFLAVEVLQGRRRVRALAAWGLAYALPVGAHVLWRRLYYGFWLPNTFYAKVAGFWWPQSLAYLGLFHEDYRILWFLPLALLALLRRREAPHILFAAALMAHLAYVGYIGGDRFEFRFLVFVLPCLYWLLADGAAALGELAGGGWPGRAVTASVAALLLAATYLGSIRPAARVTRHGVASVQDCKRYGARRREDGLFLRGLVEKGLLPADLRIAVGGAGALPYYTDWYTVDVFGLNDARIAHEPLLRRGVPGHEHAASPEYLAEKQVALWDVLDGPVLPADPAAVRQRAANAGYAGPLRCLAADGRYLVFATTLPKEAFRRAFGRLQACPDFSGGA